MSSQNLMQIDDNPETYGSKGQSWDPTFVSYMKSIVIDPAYSGMPDAVKPDGKIQWEAPSNRLGGKYQHTHGKRLDWWRRKAREIGVDINQDKWISTTAKRIHPTGTKPCKRCGRTMQISYAYPSRRLLGRLLKLFPDFDTDHLEPIADVLRRLADTYGDEAMGKFDALFRSTSTNPPSELMEIDDWLVWLEEVFTPSEPALLSPGAMSNAPDRLDGFHSFNLCCRSTADTGREPANLISYSTDRRVFEYWCDGDWIAADRMMGLISAQFRDETCADGGQNPCTADHIGPVSLGFAHRPEFRLLSRAANSSKNNRMTLSDVKHLAKVDSEDYPVTSWYSRDLWLLVKDRVVDEETALRASKLMRDNQRVAMSFLNMFLEKRHFAFLATLLGLPYAERDVTFENLRIENYLTVFDAVRYSERTTKYAIEQKARRLRIALYSLQEFVNRENRHLFPIKDSEIDRHLADAMNSLSAQSDDIKTIDAELAALLFRTELRASDSEIRSMVYKLPSNYDGASSAMNSLKIAMARVAEILAALWNDDRYVRAEFAFDAN